MKYNVGKALFSLAILIGFVVFSVGCMACTILSFVHAVKNPTLTFTQNIVYWWQQYKVWIVGSVVTYLLLGWIGRKV